jgi:hypothetical protein
MTKALIMLNQNVISLSLLTYDRGGNHIAYSIKQAKWLNYKHWLLTAGCSIGDCCESSPTLALLGGGVARSAFNAFSLTWRRVGHVQLEICKHTRYLNERPTPQHKTYRITSINGKIGDWRLKTWKSLTSFVGQIYFRLLAFFIATIKAGRLEIWEQQVYSCGEVKYISAG